MGSRLLFLAIGDLTLDRIMGPFADLPDWGHEVEAACRATRLGGNIGILAVAGKILGLDLICAGPLGADANGAWIRGEIAALGYGTEHLSIIDGAATSETFALVRTDGERAFLTYPGVLRQLGSFVLGADLPSADVAFFSGWCQPPRIATSILLERFSALRARGTAIAMDLCWHAESWRRANR